MSAEAEIERLKTRFTLQRHPADLGYFVETWKANRHVTFEATTRHQGSRATSSGVYFLLDGSKFINWHLLLSDELLFWHAGAALKVHLIDEHGNYKYQLLGDSLKTEQYSFCVTVPHDTWMAAERTGDGPYVFYSATSAPSWEVEDSADGRKDELTKKFPQNAHLFERLCIPL